MHIRVLGSAAGGGFPQWNCNCDNCQGLRQGNVDARPRTQSSITVSADGSHWALINASPDIRQQIQSFAPLQPSRAKRDTGIGAVVLIDSQIDHTTGLLVLREGERLPVYCTEMVYQDLTTGFPILSMLDHYCGVDWHRLDLGGEKFDVGGIPGLRFQAVALSSKAPPYSPHRHDPHPGDNIGLWIEDTQSGGGVFYAPGLGAIETHLEPFFEKAQCLLVDGTFWTEDEMVRRGVGAKGASAMGHLPQSGEAGMLQVLSRYPGARRVLIHINNTNPILNEQSQERATLTAAGIEVAFDGMDIHL